MGFKEVMALRQEGKLDEALLLAREDYAAQQDQWSASALFWVLKDWATKLIEENQIEQASLLVTEMEQTIGNMGTTGNVAIENLEELQKQVIPHYNDLMRLAQEIERTNNRTRIKEIFDEVSGWFANEDAAQSVVLHEAYARVILAYLQRYYKFIDHEATTGALSKYLSLQNERPSEVHSKFLKLALEIKQHLEHRFDLNKFVEEWNLSYLTPTDWARGKKGNMEGKYSLAEETLFTIMTELVNQREPSGLNPAIYQLILDAEARFPNEEMIKLMQARAFVLDGNEDQGRSIYEEILQDLEVPSAWAEFAYLVSDQEIKLGALAMALREETDEYLEYLTRARLELAKILISKELYPNALRELNIVAQISLEKSRELPPEYGTLIAKIPVGTEQDRENKDFYYTHSRAALAYIYRTLPDTMMIVYDVMALRLKGETRQVVPMLKLMGTDGKTALVSPREAGVLPGDNRGLVYQVKLLERFKKHTKVVLLTHIDINPKEFFPTQIGYINGYSESQRAHHIMDSNSRHHYLPGAEEDYLQGEFVSFILLLEQQQRKNQPLTPPREYLFHVERIDAKDAIDKFVPLRAEVLSVKDNSYVLVTEKNTRSIVKHSLSPIELEVGDNVIVRGFQQRHKDRTTGEFIYTFNTLTIEPYLE